jgi:putative nucleotidyltransferase with HDIG domain
MIDLTGLDLDFLEQIHDPVYLVGGTVRDLLTGRIPADIDLVVAGDIHPVAARVAAKTGGTVVDLGNKAFAVLRVASQQTTIDLTPLDDASIEDDLRRRDFTINALAYDIRNRRLVDCTGGQDDLVRKTIRMVSASALKNDPARLVRAYRMAAMFEFSIHAHTRQAIARECHRIRSVAGERIWAELVKLFTADRSVTVIREMAADGLLTAIFPELESARGCTQNRHHQFDVFEHSLRAYGHLEGLLAKFDTRFPQAAALAAKMDLAGCTAVLKYACLLHDVGKPATRRIDDAGQVHFYGHAAESARIAAGIGRRLRLSRKQRDAADAIIRSHIRPLFLFQAAEKNCLGRRGMARFFNHCDRLTLPIVIHTMADIEAKHQDLRDRDKRFLTFCVGLLEAYADHLDRQQSVPPLISGHDLISVFGLSPSPLFKHLLRRVDEGRLSGELATREQALDWVRCHLSSKGE